MLLLTPLIASPFGRALLYGSVGAALGCYVGVQVAGAVFAGQAAAEALAAEQATLALLRHANQRVQSAQTKAQNELAALSKHYQLEKAHAEENQRSTLAAYRSGAVRMRFATRQDSSSGHASAAPASAATGCDAATAGELPFSVASDLAELAFDADANTRQLAACQQVILSITHSVNQFADDVEGVR